MAEELEDIIIIEESDAADSDAIHQVESILDDETSKKKKIFIFALVAFFLILIIIIVLFFIFKSSATKESKTMNFIETKLEENTTKPIQNTKLDNMIAKANYLYSTGSKDEALFLYEKIALYSEAISVYNLGVAQLKDGTYELALQTFKKAIINDEKRCVSAINAAVCSLHLKDEKNFNYYIDLAYAYLAKEKNSPQYSYYYALINYYKNNYLEALSALENPTSNEYPSIQKHLRAKINALYSNDYKAIEAMEKDFHYDDSFSIALLYARVGDLTLAQKHLNESIIKNIEPVKSAIAQSFINLKAGKIATAGKQIKNVTDMFPSEVYKPYPIKVKLKDSLFDPLKAQLRFRDRIRKAKIFNYLKIFYYSPYKVFNADQTISYIQKGNANIYIDNISSAKVYLERSASSSNVNQGIVKAIKKALAFKLREANSELKELVKLQPKHSILHYDLALTYAQMGDIKEANKHFILSFHLDAKNYLSGIFAIMTNQLLNKDSTKLATIVKDSMSLEEPSEEINLYKTILNISDNNLISSADWLEKDHKQKPLYLALDTIIALGLNDIEYAKKASHKLTVLLPNEILPHMMYIDAHFSDLKPKEYAKEVLNYLKVQKFDFNDLYYGPYITRYLYTQQNLITGKLFFLRKQLREVLETTNKNTHEITSALALASLYDKEYEESYTLFNTLIDDLKVRDAYTLFLGAVASTAADHHANAVALLELSKMKDGSFLESRYALGLLYLELQNNQGAAIQFGNIGDNGFVSEYFNFDIDLDKLLFEKEQKSKD
jgi:Flp pilus assembly protein TadD